MKHLVKENKESKILYQTATKLEKEIASTLGKKGVFPNVDYYSGMVYDCLGVPEEIAICQQLQSYRNMM